MRRQIVGWEMLRDQRQGFRRGGIILWRDLTKKKKGCKRKEEIHTSLTANRKGKVKKGRKR